MTDIYHNTKIIEAFALANLATGDNMSSSIDVQGFAGMMFNIINTANTAGGLIDNVVLEESDDEITWTVLPAGATFFSGDIVLDTASLTPGDTLQIGTYGKKRYQRFNIVASAITGQTQFSGVAILNPALTAPTQPKEALA